MPALLVWDAGIRTDCREYREYRVERQTREEGLVLVIGFGKNGQTLARLCVPQSDGVVLGC
jgi:hypothetical protein